MNDEGTAPSLSAGAVPFLMWDEVGNGVTGKPPVPLQTEANENEEPLARIPRSLFSVFQPGQHRC